MRILALVPLLMLAAGSAGCSGSGLEEHASAHGSAHVSAPPEAGNPTLPASEYSYPVFYVSTTPDGPRLFEELQDSAGIANLTEPLLALGRQPDDPAYRSFWPADAFDDVGIEYSAGEAVLTLPDDTLVTRPATMTAAEAHLALQQLVYTLSAASRRRILPVVKGPDDQPVRQLLGVPVATVVPRERPARVVAPVNLRDLPYSSTVTGRFRISGVASVPRVAWTFARDHHVVLQGVALVSPGRGRVRPWETAVVDSSTLDPGTYDLVATAESPAGATTDTRVLVVK